jgi:hypothetical protein
MQEFIRRVTDVSWQKSPEGLSAKIAERGGYGILDQKYSD